MTSVATSVQTVSSSDWMLLSADLLPNNQVDVQFDPTKAHSDAWMSCDDDSLQGMELASEEFLYEPIQVSMFDEPFISVCQSLS